MLTLFLDCFSGISGDMAVGALLDLGLDPAELESDLATLGLTHEYQLHVHRASRQHVAGTKFDVHEQTTFAPLNADASHSHHSHNSPLNPHHSHAHGHAHGRTHGQIKDLLTASPLPPTAKSRALAIFERIAIAEGKIHGMPAEDVTFHEVGAIDSIVDIAAFCLGIERLGIQRVLVSRLFEGTGFIQCAHGQFPLPAPATLEILAGIPLSQIDEPLEFITPTGAAIVAEYGESFGTMPALRVRRIGYGLGTRDTAPRPNVLRAVLADSEDADPESDTVTQIETNLDDCTPELIAACTEKLLADGALDVFTTPVQMKKNRPGILLTVLCEPAAADKFATTILRETTAFGVRLHDTRRRKLTREIRTVDTPYGPIEVKFGTLGSDRLQASPEYESCRAAAIRHHAPLKDVYQSAIAKLADTNEQPTPSA
ncbi:MAG: nickel pincer cofactor biosynthesis protein LarC [Chthoniobacterales bacterium]